VILVRCLVDLRVANEPLAQLPAVVGRLRADPEDGDVVFLVSSVLIDKGRNLGTTPRSPLAAVDKNGSSPSRVGKNSMKKGLSTREI